MSVVINEMEMQADPAPAAAPAPPPAPSPEAAGPAFPAHALLQSSRLLQQRRARLRAD